MRVGLPRKSKNSHVDRFEVARSREDDQLSHRRIGIVGIGNETTPAGLCVSTQRQLGQHGVGRIGQAAEQPARRLE